MISTVIEPELYTWRYIPGGINPEVYTWKYIPLYAQEYIISIPDKLWTAILTN